MPQYQVLSLGGERVRAKCNVDAEDGRVWTVIMRRDAILPYVDFDRGMKNCFDTNFFCSFELKIHSLQMNQAFYIKTRL